MILNKKGNVALSLC